MSCCMYGCNYHNKRLSRRSIFGIPSESKELYWPMLKVKKFKQMTYQEYITSGYKKLLCCEAHFDVKDILLLSHRKSLRSSAVPHRKPQVRSNLTNLTQHYVSLQHLWKYIKFVCLAIHVKWGPPYCSCLISLNLARTVWWLTLYTDSDVVVNSILTRPYCAIFKAILSIVISIVTHIILLLGHIGPRNFSLTVWFLGYG